MEKQYKRIEWKIDEEAVYTLDMFDFGMGIVKYPAIEENFVYMDTDKINNFTFAKVTTDTPELHIITGPAMIPNKYIYRSNPLTGEEYEGMFSEETIRRYMELYFEFGAQRNASYNHNSILQDVTMVESWIVANPDIDKATTLGYTIPKGTWMISMKVNNMDLWNQIKQGKVNGFSIEGYFAEQLISLQSEILDLQRIKEIMDSTDELNSEQLSTIYNILTK